MTVKVVASSSGDHDKDMEVRVESMIERTVPLAEESPPPTGNDVQRRLEFSQSEQEEFEAVESGHQPSEFETASISMETLEHPPTCLAEQLWKPLRFVALNPKGTAIWVAGTQAVFAITCLTLRALADLLTSPGLILLLLAGAYALVFVIARSLSYPGALRLVQRDLEYDYARILKRRLFKSVDFALDLSKSLRQQPNGKSMDFHTSNLLLEVQASREDHLTPLVNALNLQMQRHAISPAGLSLQEGVEKFLRAFAALEKSLEVESDTNNNVDKELVFSLESAALSLKALTVHVGEKRRKYSGLLGFMWQLYHARQTLETAATLELMRADLLCRYDGEEVTVEGRDGNKIDAMIISAEKGVAEGPKDLTVSKAKQSSTKKAEDPSNSSIVMFCNPNAGLYECQHLQSEWIRFYLSLGCKVLLWNYRGYGRSTGSPSPSANNSDGECIVEYLRINRDIKRLGIHGESIGGMVASHLARVCTPDFIVADRTFSSLPSVARRMIAPWAGEGLKWVTRWDTDCVRNYLTSSCFKVVCCDPEDEIIADAASLKAGVAVFAELGKFDNTSVATYTKADLQGFNAPKEGDRLSEEHVQKLFIALMSIVEGIQDSETTADQQASLQQLWTLVAQCDGHCGQLLGQALARGVDGLRSWCCSLLVWAPLVLEDFGTASMMTGSRVLDQLNSIPLWLAEGMITQLLERDSYLKTEENAIFVSASISFLCTEMSERREKAVARSHKKGIASGAEKDAKTDDTAEKEVKVESTDLSAESFGHLLPVHCGHNANFSDLEKNRLTALLIKSGWTTSSQVECSL